MDPFRVKAINARWLNYWHTKTPLKKMNQIFRFGDLTFKLVLLSCLSTGRNKWYSYIPYAYVFLTYSGFVYTISYYLGNEEFEKACYPICSFGVTTMVTNDIELIFLRNCCISVVNSENLLSMQLVTSYIDVVHKPKTCHRLASLGSVHYYLDNHEQTDYNRICVESLDRLLWLIVRTSGVVIATIAFAYASGIYANFASGRRDTVFSMLFWGVAAGSDTEYYLNLMMQTNVVPYYTLGNIGAEWMVLVVENVIKLSTKLVDLYVHQLDDDLSASYSRERKNKEKLISILEEIRRSNEWIMEFTDFTYLRYFVMPYAFTYSIGFCLLCQYIVSHPFLSIFPGLTYPSSAFFQSA